MIDKPYHNKMIKDDYKFKDAKNDYTIAIHPAGHTFAYDIQYLHLNGFKTHKEAIEAGWRFK